MLKFVNNQPILLIPEIESLVISDLHIGIEYELYKSGINIPSQTSKMEKGIKKSIKQTKAKRLIILGDIKHMVPGISLQEQREIPELLEKLSKKIKIEICLGNHDTYIKDLLSDKIKIYGTKGFKIGKYGFNHGHTWPSKKLLTCDHIMIGHTHPVIQFKDKFGYKIFKQVWIKGKINKQKIKEKYQVGKTGKLEIVIVPSFNPLLGGYPINDKTKTSELLGPLLKNNFIDIDKCELYLLDGTFIGKLKNIH